MTPQNVERKLTAILSADVKGYSRLMGEDEVATIRTLTAYRELMASLIQQHRGRVVDTPGDNLLAEFASVVDAVQCAAAIQWELKARNAELPDHRKMEFRIGINLGDVIVEGERIYGDGVNIAARVEGLAEGGGICISGTAYDQIEGKLALGYEYLGEHTVKNIEKPVRVYRVLVERAAAPARVTTAKRAWVRHWQRAVLAAAAGLVVGAGAVALWNFYLRPSSPPSEVASEEKMAFPLPDKPSIAVLPFDNLSGDPEQEYFSDGMTDDLVTDLSKLSGLFVIARNSTFTYKGKPVKVQQVAEELGVRYVLEGSVRKAGDQVRINAQLIDATTGGHLWAERYDGKMDDIFALQDKITGKIITALAVKLKGDEQERITSKETDKIEAYDAFLQGWELYRRWTPEDFGKAIPYFEKAIELDPNYGRAYAALAKTYMEAYQRGGWVPRMAKSLGVSIDWPDATNEYLSQIKKYLNAAMKNPTPLAHEVKSEMLWSTFQHEEAIAEAQRAIALDSNDPNGYEGIAWALIFSGRPEEAVNFIKKAMRLDPHYPGRFLRIRGLAHFGMEQYKEASDLIERYLRHHPEDVGYQAPLAAAYAYAGEKEKARAAYEKCLKKRPGCSAFYWPYKNGKDGLRLMDGLRKAAGLD